MPGKTRYELEREQEQRRGHSVGGSKVSESSTWEEKRYPKGMSRIKSERTKTDSSGKKSETSTFTKGTSGKTTRTDSVTKNGKRTFYQRTNDY